MMRTAAATAVLLSSCTLWDQRPGCDCALPNAIAACHEDQCEVSRCADGYADLDRLAANGCECTIEVESCNGADDDCDGLIDQELVGQQLISTCICESTRLLVDSMRIDLSDRVDCRTRDCRLPAPAMELDYCCDPTGAWSQCAFGNINLEAFDADHAGSGLLEVIYHLPERVTGLALSLYYGDYPRRKRLSLLTAEQSSAGIGPGTYFTYFEPTDAECPRYTAEDAMNGGDAFRDFPPACLAGASLPPNWSCAGRWGERSPECIFDYDPTLLFVTAEFCSARVESTVEVLSVRHLPAPSGCTCSDDRPCPAGEQCRPEANLCSPLDTCRAGERCTVTIGQRSCDSRIECLEGRPICPLPADCG